MKDEEKILLDYAHIKDDIIYNKYWYDYEGIPISLSDINSIEVKEA